VGTAEPQYFNRAGFAVKDEAAIEGHGWQSDLHTLELGEIGLSLGNVFLGGSSLFERGGLLQVRFQLFDRGGHGRDFVLHTGNAALFDACTSGLGGDDLNSSGPRAGICFIALIVVPVKVCVDNEPDRLGRELLNLLDEGAGGGRF